jgi:hypothetical protein
LIKRLLENYGKDDWLHQDIKKYFR